MKAIDLKEKIRLFGAILLAVFMFQGIQYAQNNSDNKDNAYNKIAKDLTSRLSKRVNLTRDQAGKVQDVLVDYQKDIADKWEKNLSANNSGNKTDIKDDLRDADKKANDKIEKTLSGNEISSYMNVKKDWWAKIKDRVYSRDFIDLVNYKEEDESSSNVGSKDQKDEKSANKSSDEKDLSSKFEPFSKQMATDLMQKLNLSLQQAADIQDALVDYQKSVADIRERDINKSGDNSVVASNDRNMNPNNRSENVGSSKNNRISEFRDIDDSANEKLEKILNDNQKPKYEKIKKTWWRDVKDKVYANIQHENRTMSNK